MAKDSNVMMWTVMTSYIAEEEKQLKDENVYKDDEFNEKIF